MDEMPAGGDGATQPSTAPPPASLVKPGLGMPKALFGLVVVAAVVAAAGAGAMARWTAVVMGLVLVFGLCVVGLVVRRSQRDLLAFKREHKRWPTTGEVGDWNQEMHGRRAKARAVALAARTAKTALRAYAQQVAQAERALQSAQRQRADAIGSARSGLAAAERAHAEAIAQATAALEAWRNPGRGGRITGFKGIELHQHALAVKGTSLPLLYAQAAFAGNRLTLHTSAKQEVVKLTKQEVPAALQFASQVMAAAAAEVAFQQQRPAAIPAAEHYLGQVTADTSRIGTARNAVAAAEANPTLLGAIGEAEESLAAVRADTHDLDAAQAELSVYQTRAVERQMSTAPPTWVPRASNAGIAFLGIALVGLLVGGTGATILNVPATPTARVTATSTPTASPLPSPRTNHVASANALARAISSAGLGCIDYKADNQPPFAATQGRCHAGADELVLAQYSTTDQRDQHAERLRSLLAGLDSEHLRVNVGTRRLRQAPTQSP